MKKEVIIGCAGRCGKSAAVEFENIKKHDYYICGDEECSAALFAMIEQKSKKSFTDLVKKHTALDQKAAGDLMGVSFFKRVKGKREFGVYGEQKLMVNGEENVFALIPRENGNNSAVCNTQNKFSIDDIEGFWGIDGNDFPDPDNECLPDEDEIVGFNIINEDGSMEYISLIDDTSPSLRSIEDILIFCETKLLHYYKKTGKKTAYLKMKFMKNILPKLAKITILG